MIDVGVRQHDAADWRTQTLCRFAYAGRRTGNASINERESIVFPDQETIDHAKACQTKEVFCFLIWLHTRTRELGRGRRCWRWARLGFFEKDDFFKATFAFGNDQVSSDLVAGSK